MLQSPRLRLNNQRLKKRRLWLNKSRLPSHKRLKKLQRKKNLSSNQHKPYKNQNTSNNQLPNQSSKNQFKSHNQSFQLKSQSLKHPPNKLKASLQVIAFQPSKTSTQSWQERTSDKHVTKTHSSWSSSNPKPTLKESHTSELQMEAWRTSKSVWQVPALQDPKRHFDLCEKNCINKN